MCGLVGAMSLISNSENKISEEILVKMRDTMIHRGPDGAGIWISDNKRIGLAHRRLSIIDLSESASQPMANKAGNLHIVFNGEIYNHAEIRSELNAIRKFQWQTHHSDTEVIINAFEQWGLECLQRFRGMFAIAIWDSQNEKLWLIRDRLGIKPLYYSFHSGKITFASEIKALLADPKQHRSVNEKALFNYLSFLTAPAPDTLFEGISKLPPASWLSVDGDGKINQGRYWDPLDQQVNIADTSEDKIAQMVIDELRSSVLLHKESDVPLGVFLSGGIDSSTITAILSETANKETFENKIKSFSIGYEGDYKSYRNELEFAKFLAKDVGAEYHQKLLTVNDLINFLPDMIKLQDEPIADPVCFPVFFVSKLAKDNKISVCQVGEGADELFFGYPGWKTLLRLEKLNLLPIPGFIKKTCLKIMYFIGKENKFSYEWLRRGILDQPIFWGGAEAFTNNHKHRLLSSRLRKKFANKTSWEVIKPIRERFEKKNKMKSSESNWMTYLDINFRLPELLLMRVDKMCMGVSLEARVPFLDHKVVELAMSIPEKLKIKNGTLKYILKKAVCNIIPLKIIKRKKQGFGVPIHEWFFNELEDKIRKDLENFCDKTDFFDKKEVLLLIANKNAVQVWYLYNFALWWNEYIDE
jgi:asparagine synthase (glutamine-hydrolysing)